MGTLPSAERFVETWESAESVVHASVVLCRLGYYEMTPRIVWRWAETLRGVGVNLKKIPRPAALHRAGR